jgi:phytoene synthase
VNSQLFAASRRSAGATIARHSQSFALAARLLPAVAAGDAVILYAYCRRVDDVIDRAARSDGRSRLRTLREELGAVCGSRPVEDPLLAAVRWVVGRRRVPRAYFDALLDGMEMDVTAARYESFEDLLGYCYRVAGTIGLMMCHVMGVRGEGALAHAAHLGMAMQLTNIARDVLEDWNRGRLYIPDELLENCGAPDLRSALGEPLPRSASDAVARATAALLDLAEGYYRSGDEGLRYLSPRCAFAVRTARLVYSRIGGLVRACGCDPFAPRAVVARRTKLALAARAAFEVALRAPTGLLCPPARIPGERVDDPGKLFLRRAATAAEAAR